MVEVLHFLRLTLKSFKNIIQVLNKKQIKYFQLEKMKFCLLKKTAS